MRRRKPPAPRCTEKTEGTLGFWWYGRFALHGWDMPLTPIEEDLSSYSHVTLCSPIWVFSLAAPMRTFCRTYGKEIQEADCILLHHTPGAYKAIAVTMEVESGALDILIAQRGGDVVYRGNEVQSGAFVLEITESGEYEISVTGRQGRGTLTFEMQRRESK